MRWRRSLKVVIIASALPTAAHAQSAAAPLPNPSPYGVLSKVGTQSARPIRVARHSGERLSGRLARLDDDSIIVVNDHGRRAISMADIDSVWTQRGSLAGIIGIFAAVPCAILGGLFGNFLGNDPDSGGRPGHGAGAAAAVAVEGGLACGFAGAALGSAIRPWRLEYPR